MSFIETILHSTIRCLPIHIVIDSSNSYEARLPAGLLLQQQGLRRAQESQFRLLLLPISLFIPPSVFSFPYSKHTHTHTRPCGTAGAFGEKNDRFLATL